MQQLSCPHCGPRDEHEYAFGGEAHLVRPDESVDDETWSHYLYFRDNPKGIHYERWCHSFGCGTWFNVARDTVTHQVMRVYAITAPRPAENE